MMPASAAVRFLTLAVRRRAGPEICLPSALSLAWADTRICRKVHVPRPAALCLSAPAALRPNWDSGR
jgi:hypothetical protein